MQEQRAHFVLDWEAGEMSLSALCRHYQISRKTGYKWLRRYQAGGVAALADRSRAPLRQPRAVSPRVQQCVLELKAAHSHWGERKLGDWLRKNSPDQSWPADSTIGMILKRHGLTAPRRPRRHATPSPELSQPAAPNHLWAIDFKGWFRTADGRRCDPLTISDSDTRYVLRCQVVERPDEQHVRPILEATFRQHGLPRAIRSDNGAPFATTGRGGLSRLAVWWIRLGIAPERIAPGRPEQNGRHERMHRELKRQTANPPARNAREQQKAFDRFRWEYNEQRPHEGLGMATPGSLYESSPREYPARLPELEYPAGRQLRRVSESGEISYGGRAIFISEVLAGEVVAIEREQQERGRVWFGPLELGWVDLAKGRMEESSRRGGRRR